MKVEKKELFVVDDKHIFNTQEEAEVAIKNMKVGQIMGESFPGLNQVTASFLESLISSPQARYSLRQFIDKAGEILGGDMKPAR